MDTEGQISRKMTISNKKGLHARASASFARVAEDFEAEIRVLKDGYNVGATSIMGLMLLAASNGSTITVQAQGVDAAEAIDAIEALVQNRFGEDS